MRKINAGFTMVEMLVVTGIISLLAISSFIMARGSLAEARDTKRYKDLDAIEAALYAFYSQNGHFPDTNNQWWDVCTSNTLDISNHITDGGWIPGLAPDFITSLPNDPQGCKETPGNFNGYIYRSNTGGRDFKLATDWTAEEGELCDDPGDKYYDARRGPGQIWFQDIGFFFCSISSPGGTNF